MDSLYNPDGHRLYLTASERAAFLKASAKAPRVVRSFCEVLHYTGCRLSEATALTPRLIDFENKALIFETLKKRREGVFRAVPIPDALLDTLNLVHGLTDGQTRRDELLWHWSRTTAWRKVKAVMQDAGIEEGVHASPKGLRHGYGVGAISAGVPLNMLSKWMGHSKIETTAIYANALGEEQHQIAERMWSN